MARKNQLVNNCRFPPNLNKLWCVVGILFCEKITSSVTDGNDDGCLNPLPLSAKKSQDEFAIILSFSLGN